MTRWVCDYCGQTGQSSGDEPFDTLQCPDCGEPVQERFRPR